MDTFKSMSEVRKHYYPKRTERIEAMERNDERAEGSAHFSRLDKTTRERIMDEIREIQS